MASPPWIPLIVLSFLAIITACNARLLSDDDVDKIIITQPLLPSVISCSTAGNYSDGSQYHVNLDRLLSGIPMAAAKDGGFFNGTFGTAGDKVFALFMCYAGDTDSECQDCLTTLAERIAEGTQRFADTQWVWAVAQCTRDLPASECTHCLSYYTDQLRRLFRNNSGGAIKGYSCYLGYAILADKPSTVRPLNRYRYSENYARKMAVQELEHQREMADEESRRRTRRRNIVIIVGLVTIAVLLCLLFLSLWYRWRRWVAAIR